MGDDVAARFAAISSRFGYSFALYEKLAAQYGVSTVDDSTSESALGLLKARAELSVRSPASPVRATTPTPTDPEDADAARDDEAEKIVVSDEEDFSLGTLKRRLAAEPSVAVAAPRPRNAALFVEEEAAEAAGSEGGEEGSEGEDEYDFDDGFLVDDDEEEEDEDAEEEEGSERDDDGAAVAPRSGRPPPSATPARAKPKVATTPQPFGLSSHAHGRNCACKVGGSGCDYTGLRDGDKDPKTGLVFVREEFERSGHGGGASKVGTPLGSPAGVQRAAFRNKAHRDGMTAALFAEYNGRVFGGQLPASLPLEWSPRLTKTAGMTYTSKGSDASYKARIGLSVKVLDSPYKLAQTLLHELCHVAAWVVDHCSRPPHGAVFGKWAKLSTALYPSRTVTVCHNYEIAHKHRYQCQTPACGYVYGRHSKSIDTAAVRCGMCPGSAKGLLVMQPTLKLDGTPAKATPARQSDYLRFIAAERPAAVLALGPGAAPAKVLAELAKRWNAHKAALHAGGQAAAIIDLTEEREEKEGVELDFAQLQLDE